jgi:hypothetical protein
MVKICQTGLLKLN